MIKYFSLGLLFIASPVFAVIDGNIGGYIGGFQPVADKSVLQNVAYMIMIIIHLAMIVFTCNVLLKKNSIQIKLLSALAPIIWTELIYNAYIKISTLPLYLFLMGAMIVVIFLIIKYSLKSVNKDNSDKWLKLTLLYVLLFAMIAIVTVHEVYAPVELPMYYEL